MDSNFTIRVDFAFDYIETTSLIKGIINPVFGMIAIVINMIIIVIYSRQYKTGSRKRRSSNVLVIGISLTFFMLLLPVLPWNIYAFGFKNIHNNKSTCFWWNVFDIYILGPHISGTIIGASLLYQRYTVLKWPLKANLWWSPCRCLIIVVIANVFGMLIALFRMFSFSLNVELKPNTTQSIDMVAYTCQRRDAEWIDRPVVFEVIWSLLLVTSMIASMFVLLYILVYTYKTSKQDTKAKDRETKHQDLQLTVSNTASEACFTEYAIDVKRNSPQQRALRVSTKRIAIMASTLLCGQSVLCILATCAAVVRILKLNGICLECENLEDSLFKTIAETLITPCLSLMSMYTFLMTRQVKSILCSVIKRANCLGNS